MVQPWEVRGWDVFLSSLTQEAYWGLPPDDRRQHEARLREMPSARNRRIRLTDYRPTKRFNRRFISGSWLPDSIYEQAGVEVANRAEAEGTGSTT